MLCLINANTMTPPIAPLGLEYVAQAAVQAGITVRILDLCLETDRAKTLSEFFSTHTPDLVGISFRNVDDSFWPSCRWFVPDLIDFIQTIRPLTEAPILVGGVGFSIFGRPLFDLLPVEFGIRGDGEIALPALYHALEDKSDLASVPGLIYDTADGPRENAPAWPVEIDLPTSRDLIDNVSYFRLGGQIGFEAKRGCPRHCLYCADPLAKGDKARLRSPRKVALELKALVGQGIDVFHTCDSEFNVPYDHALAVCHEIIHQGLHNKIQWYAYLSVAPFNASLASAMQRAGCVGIDFTTDAASAAMLKTYGQPYDKQAIAHAVTLAKAHGMTVMTDMLLGGPGETPETIAETIHFMKEIDPHAIGAGLGLRVYPGTPVADRIQSKGPLDTHPGIRRKYSGPVDLLRPTFYISEALGPDPVGLIKTLIRDDPRFFEPMDDTGLSKDHNYNDNPTLLDAIEQGQRGAFWHILLKARA